ncbi:esterase-like activity of phytase family protein [Pseudochelatococcus lubricantis]|uniref:esterase-like activity of phytase family protein n=1 Tax=Pseudochelatococcus lubricantis TaxID=1538102 RepID=UPI0035F02B1A
MRIPSSVFSALLFSALVASPAMAEQEFTATLKGHAALPALTIIDAPADAPADLRVAGKYATGKATRVDEPESVEGINDGRPTGIKFPFKGQAVQGHSGIKADRDGTFWVITDNGMGNKANSPDNMLFIHHYAIDWKANAVNRLSTTFLHDPDKKVPFRIAEEGTEKRYLTGSDFDLESFQLIGDKIWFGEEFGPYLIRTDRDGKVEAVIETEVAGKVVRSPDHYNIKTPGAPGKVDFEVRRSKGFEGMASSPDGKFLYPLLEGALWDAATNATEKDNGKEYLRILEFDVANQKWTGRFWKFPLEENGHSIGDFNMVDATHGLIIERDDTEGTASKACPAGEKRKDCFATPAKFKRVYKIELTDENAGKDARKIGYIDLMKIQDPDKVAIKGEKNGTLDFPFFTIENVDVVDATHIIVGNDNNLPFSASRDPNKADDNEFILLEVKDFLAAK